MDKPQNETKTLQPLATKAQTAVFLGVTQKTVDKLRKELKLKAIKVGNQVRFKWQDLENLNYEEVVNN